MNLFTMICLLILAIFVLVLCGWHEWNKPRNKGPPAKPK